MSVITIFNSTTFATPTPSSSIQAGLYDVNLILPIQGLWVADVITDSVPLVDGATPDNLTPGFGVTSFVYLDLGGDWVFPGQVLRYGVWRDAMHLRIVGANAGFGLFPGAGLSRASAPWASVYTSLLNKTDPYLSFEYGSGFVSGFGLTNTNITPSGSRRSSSLMDVLTHQLNQTAGRVLFQAGFLSRFGVPAVLHWRALPLSKAANPALENGTFSTLFPIALVYDYDKDATGQTGAPIGASYNVDVTGSTDGLELSNANTLAPWSAQLVGGVSTQPLIDGVAALRDLAPETGIESYGVEYPVLLPGNWYNSPMAPYTYLGLDDDSESEIGPTLQALEVQYRFRDNKLEMYVRSSSAFSVGVGVDAYTTPVQSVYSGSGGNW